MERYFETLSSHIAMLSQEKDNICKAAEVLAKAVTEEKLIHVFGVDPHSAMLEGELFFKGGCLVNINPIFDPAFDFSHGAYRSALCQTLDGLAPCILDYYENIESGDPIILMGNCQGSLIFEQAAQWSRQKGLIVITIASADGTADEAAKSYSDIIINLHTPAKDAVTKVSGIWSGGVRTACMAAVLNALMVETLVRVVHPVTWQGDLLADPEVNATLIDEYLWKIKHL